VQDRLLIRFSDQQPLERFETTIDGHPLLPGYGFNLENTTYSINLDDIPSLSGKPVTTPSFDITVSFKQRNVIAKTMDINLVSLPLNTALYSSSTRITFNLPAVDSILSKLTYYLNVAIHRKRDMYVIEPLSEPLTQSFIDLDLEKVDLKKGIAVFDTCRDIKGPLQFVYKFTAILDLPSLALGAIFAIIGAVIVDLVSNYIIGLIWGKSV
jgi:hypothetical protein